MKGCYVYCFCDAENPEVSGLLGVDECRVEAMEVDGIVAIISARSGPPAGSPANIMAHNRVIKAVLSVTTPVPCRFGAMLSGPELEAYVDTHGAALRRLLERFRGCVEMSLRIVWDLAVPLRQGEEEIRDHVDQLLSQGKGPGSLFLLERIRQVSRQQRASVQAQAILDWIDGRFVSVVKDKAARLAPESALVADVAHLIDGADINAYRDLYTSAARERKDLGLSMSGPWAPYSFTYIDEFGTKRAVQKDYESRRQRRRAGSR